jgi:hypothetical protein
MPVVAHSNTSLQTVFVSHYRKDMEGQLFLSHVFNQEGSRFVPRFYSEEKPQPPHAAAIIKRIEQSSVLVVLLSPELAEKPHTRSWVGFEVGVAAHRGIPVFVIEPAASAPIDFPVPGTTHYALRPATAQSISGTFWSSIARTSFEPKGPEYSDSPGVSWGTKNLAGLYGLTPGTTSVGGTFSEVRCQNDPCKASYFVEYGMTSKPFYCPVCRKETATFLTSLRVAAEKHSEEAARKQHSASGGNQGVAGGIK